MEILRGIKGWGRTTLCFAEGSFAIDLHRQFTNGGIS
jgi:hypothetical protein